MKAAQASAHPLKAAQGLLWVWGESGPTAAAEAAAEPLKADPDVEDQTK
jgi:phenylpropionate dioxygenase-like ring-hydroxylating dioxygenase large terminal subunit